MGSDPLWPQYSSPEDLAAIESIPLAERGIPDSTYAVLRRSAELWPERTALTVLPDATRWQQPVRRTFGGLLTDVHKAANLFRDCGVSRQSPVALISPNC